MISSVNIQRTLHFNTCISFPISQPLILCPSPICLHYIVFIIPILDMLYNDAQ